jgi:regulator of replication initiation timing
MDDILLFMENAQLKKTVEALTDELKSMKMNLEMLALENSDLIVSNKSKRTAITKAKWEYYHEHKAQVRKDMQREMQREPKWFEVKRVCDAQWLALVNIDPQSDKKDDNE